MRGMTAKAYREGFNVIRMNQRTCGGTDHLTPTLYNSGLSSDYRAIIRELRVSDRLTRIWLVGYSMGGNLALKAAGELEQSDPALAGVVASVPNIDPDAVRRSAGDAQELALSLALPLRSQSENATESRTLSRGNGTFTAAFDEDDHPV